MSSSLCRFVPLTALLLLFLLATVAAAPVGDINEHMHESALVPVPVPIPESTLPATVHLTRTAVFEHVTASASASATLAATVLPIPSASTSARALPTEPSSLQTTDPSPDPIPVGAVIGLVIGISMFVVIVLFLAISCIRKQRGIVEVGQPRQVLKRVGSRSGLAANAASPATGGRGF